MNSEGDPSRNQADCRESAEDHVAQTSRTSVSLDSLDSAATLTYHDETETYRTEYDRRVDAPQEVVINCVAALENSHPIELDPLYTVLDPDALDQVFAPMANGQHCGDGKVTFDYHGYGVTLHSYGVIAIRPEPAER